MTALGIIWFGLLALFLVAYTILDGFDLGVGWWYLFVRRADQREAMLKSIAPFWDGNEVWLLLTGGALFAAFPAAYATTFSAMYLPLVLVLIALILRAVGFTFHEYSSDQANSRWGLAFSIGSLVTIILLGVALGNILHGLPLDARGDFTGNVEHLLHPYCLLFGVLNLALLAHHGALYIELRTDGELARQAHRWARITRRITLVVAVVAIVVSAVSQPHLMQNYAAMPALWLLPLAACAALIASGRFAHRERIGWAFGMSCTAIAALLASAAVALFPRLVPAIPAAHSITIANAASSPLSLATMLGVGVIGLALVVGYTVWVYRTFGVSAVTLKTKRRRRTRQTADEA